MRGLEKTALDGANGHGDSMTNSAQWGRVGENSHLLRRDATNGQSKKKKCVRQLQILRFATTVIYVYNFFSINSQKHYILPSPNI